MIRISGVVLEPNKHIWVALCAIFGIGKSRAILICKNLSIDPMSKVSTLSADFGPKIQAQVDRFEVEGDLRRKIAINIKRLRDIKCYRGIRHRRGLPVRGQRTKTNARTRRGKKTTVGGTAKKVAAKT